MNNRKQTYSSLVRISVVFGAMSLWLGIPVADAAEADPVIEEVVVVASYRDSFAATMI